jgi:hypothetical protein
MTESLDAAIKSMRQNFFKFAASQHSLTPLELLNGKLWRPVSETSTKNQVRKEPMTKKTALKIRNKFYIGHPKITSEAEQGQMNDPAMASQPVRWTRATLEDAIKHAELRLEANPKEDHCVIVQVIRIVRRKRAPVIVEKV